MADFGVQFEILDRARIRCAELAGDSAVARHYVDAHDLDAGGGLAGLILSHHKRIRGEVDQVLWTAQNILTDFSEDFGTTYRTYRRGETMNDEQFHRLWTELDADPTGTSHPAQSPPGSPRTLELGHDRPSSHLAEPVAPDTSITVMATIDAVVDGGVSMSARSGVFQGWFHYLTGMDFNAEVNRILAGLVGDWRAVGLLGDLYRNYGQWFGAAGTCVRDSGARVGQWWSGEAATFALTQFQQFGYTLYLTEDDLTTIGQRYWVACLGIYGLIDDVATAVTNLLDHGAEVEETLLLIDPSAPIPVVIGQIIGDVIAIAEQLCEAVAEFMILVRAVKYLLEIIALVQAAFADLQNRLPSSA